MPSDLHVEKPEAPFDNLASSLYLHPCSVRQKPGLAVGFFVVTMFPLFQWRHHGQEEIEATRMDPRRRSRTEEPCQVENTGKEDCQVAQANGRSHPTEGVQLGRVARIPRLAPSHDT